MPDCTQDHLMTGVLAPTIRMEDQPRRWLARRPGHPQRLQHQLARHMPGNGPADNLAGEQIMNSLVRPELPTAARVHARFK